MLEKMVIIPWWCHESWRPCQKTWPSTCVGQLAGVLVLGQVLSFGEKFVWWALDVLCISRVKSSSCLIKGVLFCQDACFLVKVGVVSVVVREVASFGTVDFAHSATCKRVVSSAVSYWKLWKMESIKEDLNSFPWILMNFLSKYIVSKYYCDVLHKTAYKGKGGG